MEETLISFVGQASQRDLHATKDAILESKIVI